MIFSTDSNLPWILPQKVAQELSELADLPENWKQGFCAWNTWAVQKPYQRKLS